jgi:hypothetical protein
VRLDRGAGLYDAIGSCKMSLKMTISKLLRNQQVGCAQVQARLSQLSFKLHNFIGEFMSSDRLVDMLAAPVIFIVIAIALPWRPGPRRPSVRFFVRNQHGRISSNFFLASIVFCIRKSQQQSLHDCLVRISN